VDLKNIKDQIVKFDNTYSKLPGMFYEKIQPEKVPSPELIKFNNSLGDSLMINLKNRNNVEKANIFSGNSILDGSDPIAQVYAGHQFGHFVTRLGDGRAVLLGEVINQNGNRNDIALKGSGRTMFSRGGDGKAPLGAVIREYILSEALYFLGIPTTRSLAIIKTGEDLYRDNILPGGILCRVAASHIRIGTFEYFAYNNDKESIKLLADYVIERHYKQIKDSKHKYLQLFELVIDRQASLIAKWMSVGFIHGVMNTDNTLICGETIDYGPCAFIDKYEEDIVFSSIDFEKRYSFENQKQIMKWNLSKLGECLVYLIGETEKEGSDIINKSLELYEKKFEEYWLNLMMQKMGFFNHSVEDTSLLYDLIDIMRENKVDYTLCFRYLCDAVENDVTNFLNIFKEKLEIELWLSKWKSVLDKKKISSKKIAIKMRQLNPAFIPRNHQVEEAIQLAVEKNDLSLMNKLLQILKYPYSSQPENVTYMEPPQPNQKVYQTFCGT
jgi:serine/tyrosine/threonine adenylyltransferase